jgi:hypothetical protein
VYTHICIYINYRGYGKSTGIPTPTGLKNDGCIVAKYLRNIKGVSRLVIHGESVGMFECMSMSMCIYIYMYRRICILIYIYPYVCLCTDVYIYIYMYIYVCVVSMYRLVIHGESLGNRPASYLSF